MRLSPVAQLAQLGSMSTLLADSQMCDHVPKDTVGWVSADLVNNSCLREEQPPSSSPLWWLWPGGGAVSQGRMARDALTSFSRQYEMIDSELLLGNLVQFFHFSKQGNWDPEIENSFLKPNHRSKAGYRSPRWYTFVIFTKGFLVRMILSN